MFGRARVFAVEAARSAAYYHANHQPLKRLNTIGVRSIASFSRFPNDYQHQQRPRSIVVDHQHQQQQQQQQQQHGGITSLFTTHVCTPSFFGANAQQRRTYIPEGLALDKVKKMRLLKKLGSTQQEVEQYLKLYSQVDTRRFGVFKVGGGVLLNEMDDLCSSISALVECGLIPVIVHGAGPQLNQALKELGIVSTYVSGLRVTTPDILAVARKVFQRENLRLVKALESQGVRARPVQSGVYEVQLYDNGRLGHVGEIIDVNLDPINEAIESGCVPVLTCMGQTADGQFLNVNADTAAQMLSQAIKPMKVVYISSNGGLLDQNGQVIQSIDINYDSEHLFNQPWFQHGDRRKLLEIKELMSLLPRSSTVSITSAKLVAKELLTHSLSGTLITNQERFFRHEGLNTIDRERVLMLLEQSFGAPLIPNFLDSIENSIRSIYISEMYHACAIITDQVGIPYLSKFAVSQSVQMEGLGRRMWQQIRQDHPTLIWRSRRTNPINRWYFQHSEGSHTTPDWTVFWYGIGSLSEAIDPIARVLELPKDVMRSTAVPSPMPVVEAKRRISKKAPEDMVFSIGLLGARGHTGVELIKLIEKHPFMKLEVASSRALKNRKVAEVVEGSSIDLMFQDLSPEEVAHYDKQVDLWFLAMPDKQSEPFLAQIGEDSVVIDLSSDHRFDDSWVYGLPEMDVRQSIRMSTRIANPGCYATASILSLLPLFRTEGETDTILRGVPNLFGISGYSGAGTTPNPRNDVTRLENNILAYSLVGHTHEREISRQLSQFGSENNRDLSNGVRFMPHVASYFRGIHLTVSADLSGKLSREDLIYRYRTFYEGEPTIDVTDELPEVKYIVGHPKVAIGGFALSPDNKRLVLAATIDNLLKGAATQAMQNANLTLGLDEHTAIIDPINPELAML